MADKFLTQGDNSGWLLVRRVRNNERTALPHYLKVDHTATRTDPRLDAHQRRDFFKALEGSYNGAEFSVALKADGSSYLTTTGQHLTAARVVLDRTGRRVWYGEGAAAVGPLSAEIDSYNPIPFGTYELEIPDAPHGGGRGYTNRSSYATVWFRIRPSGANTSLDRYFHPGRVSAGCVTVTDIDRWTAAYEYLINRRKDDVSVGTITVL